MQVRHTSFYQLLALLVTMMWGLNYVSSKVLFLQGAGPMGVLAVKIAIAWAVLALIAPKWIFADSPKHELMFALLGLTYVPLYQGLETLAIYHGQVSDIASVMACSPLMVAVIAVLGLKNAKVHWTMWLGIIIALTGVCLILIDTGLINGLSIMGIFLALGAGLGWALHSMFLKSFAGYPPSFIMRKAMGYGLLMILPFAFYENSLTLSMLEEPVVVGNFLFLAIGVMVIASVLWMRVTHELGNQAVEGWLYLVPLIAMTTGVFVLDNEVTFIGVMGLIMILCGVWAGQYGAKRISAAFAAIDAVPS